MSNNISPFAAPLYIMTKPIGSACNMACKYCYYLEKANLYKGTGPRMMSDELLEKFVKEYIESQTMNDVLFMWHGGEALLRPISFYKKAIKLQQKYAAGRHIDNCIQTNGLLLDEKWCRFFAENHWLVGISIDGPKEFHDAYRHTNQGQPTYYRVMQGMRLLNTHKVEWNALAVVNNLNAKHPKEFYKFFRDIKCKYIQFTPICERDENGELTKESVTPEDWGDFLCGVFDEWVKKDVGTYFVQLFDATLANWCGVAPGLCSMAKTCGHAGVMEHNGDIYSCDHFVFPEYKLGNIYEQSIVEMMYSERQKAFGAAKFTSLPHQCKECQYLFACNGECPKNRFARTADGEDGLNYLCAGYHKFFEHVTWAMDFMKNELNNQRPPANIIDFYNASYSSDI